MKEVVGYLLNRETGNGIAGKPVSFLQLDTSPVPTTASSVYTPGSAGGVGNISCGQKDTVTDANGRFSAWWELSPGPVKIEIESAVGPPTPETKVRHWDEKAQLGYQWSSDISRIARGQKAGVVRGFLNELSVTPAGSGHNLDINTGAAIFNGGVFSIENGPITIAGTPNTNPALTSRWDLITLRQYNETAAGQLAGKQTIVITEGSSMTTIDGVPTGVAPATPAGSDFIDLPIWIVATAYNGTVKTIPTNGDLRVFPTPSTADLIPKIAFARTYAIGGTVNLTTTYQKWADATISGLNAATTYDGYLRFFTAFASSLSTGGVGFHVLFDTALTTPPVTPAMTSYLYNQGDIPVFMYTSKYEVDFSWPLVGVTGKTSYTIPIRFRNNTAGLLWQMTPNGWWMIELKPRI